MSQRAETKRGTTNDMTKLPVPETSPAKAKAGATRAGAIRVLLIDDSPLALALQQKMLATAPDIIVVGTASNGREALQLLPELQPCVVCTDFQMPVMNGLQVVQEIMATSPLPILVISSLSQPDDHRALLPLLAAGALDVFHKPDATQDFAQTAHAFVEKIRVLSGVFVFARHAPQTSAQSAKPNAATPNAATPSAATPSAATFKAATSNIEYSKAPAKAKAAGESSFSSGLSRKEKTHQPDGDKISSPGLRVVGVGASTGGPQVLREIFSQLPPGFPHPILCVQHISAGFQQGLVEWLNDASRLHIKAMSEGEIARGGTIYFPIEGRHMTLDAQGQLISTGAPPVDGHRPSVTALFSSLAQHCGKDALAILLTGMGEDGARGLLEVSRAGGQTIAQNEASCVVFGMPAQAIAQGAAQRVLPIDEIARALKNSAHSQNAKL